MVLVVEEYICKVFCVFVCYVIVFQFENFYFKKRMVCVYFQE